jgi:FKBP12-rapamycin complex-associated protein
MIILFCLLSILHYRGPRAQRPGIGGVESSTTQTNRFVSFYSAIEFKSNRSLGRDFNPNVVLTVQAQVDKLILQATSLENLCQCFSGWYDPCTRFSLSY